MMNLGVKFFVFYFYFKAFKLVDVFIGLILNSASNNTKLQDIWNKSWYPKAADHVNTEKTWYVVDATDKVLGRLASTIAIHIRGKNLATYTPSVDMGAFVIVVCILE